MHRYIKLFIFTAMMFAIISCSEDSNDPGKAGTFDSQSVTLGNGTAYAWVELDNDGNPVKYGLKISESALSGLGDQMSETVINLPAEFAKTNINHITLDWNPHGHEPEGVFDLPHFDMHFYFVDQAFRDGIDPADTAKCNHQPDAAMLPPGYIIPPGCVPRMGAHAIDAQAPEMNGEKFTKTFIYGFWDGQMIFLEPMITTEYLENTNSAEMVIKTPQMYPSAGYYPAKLTINHDTDAKVYVITLTDLMKYE